MPTFWFRGRAVLEGVEFEIEADNMEEAIAKAKKGECEDTHTNMAEMVDWTIHPSTGEEDTP